MQSGELRGDALPRWQGTARWARPARFVEVALLWQITQIVLRAQFLNFSIFCFRRDRNQLSIAPLPSDMQPILVTWSFPTVLLPVKGDLELVDISSVGKKKKKKNIVLEFHVCNRQHGLDPPYSLLPALLSLTKAFFVRSCPARLGVTRRAHYWGWVSSDPPRGLCPEGHEPPLP